MNFRIGILTVKILLKHKEDFLLNYPTYGEIRSTFSLNSLTNYHDYITSFFIIFTNNLLIKPE